MASNLPMEPIDDTEDEERVSLRSKSENGKLANGEEDSSTDKNRATYPGSETKRKSGTLKRFPFSATLPKDESSNKARNLDRSNSVLHSAFDTLLRTTQGAAGLDPEGHKAAAIAKTTLFLIEENENFDWSANVGQSDDEVFVDPSNPPTYGKI